jgi:hypothetical protein
MPKATFKVKRLLPFLDLRWFSDNLKALKFVLSWILQISKPHGFRKTTLDKTLLLRLLTNMPCIQ